MIVKKLGIIGTIQLAATLVFAMPALGFGFLLVRDGDVILGIASFLFAAIMVVLMEYVTPTPRLRKPSLSSFKRTTEDEE